MQSDIEASIVHPSEKPSLLLVSSATIILQSVFDWVLILVPSDDRKLTSRHSRGFVSIHNFTNYCYSLFWRSNLFLPGGCWCCDPHSSHLLLHKALSDPYRALKPIPGELMKESSMTQEINNRFSFLLFHFRGFILWTKRPVNALWPEQS